MWKDQDGETLLTFSSTIADDRLLLAIDKLPSGYFRVTVGNLFWFRELMWGRNLEAVLRAVNRLINYDGSQRVLKLLMNQLEHDFPKPVEET